MIRLALPPACRAAVEASGGPPAASATVPATSTPTLEAAAPTLPAVVVEAAQPEPAVEPVIVAAEITPATSTRTDTAAPPAEGNLIRHLKIALAGLPPPAIKSPRVPSWPTKHKEEKCSARMLKTKTA